MEIAGLSRGSEYDAFDITGSLNLDGELQAIFLEGYTPGSNHSFAFFEVSESINGVFNNIILPDISEQGLSWDTSSLYSTGTLSTIPEPRTYALLFGLMALAFAFWRKRRIRGSWRGKKENAERDFVITTN